MTVVKPNFFILGAPKCGTTSLARWLSEHPRIFMSPVKEPHYFSTDLGNQVVRSRQRYERLFNKADDNHLAIGEASTWYLYSNSAVPAIEEEYPESKYIVMTRDPVAMAHSLYHHNVRVLHEDQLTFEQAWELQETRQKGQSIPPDCTEPAFLQYRQACSLGTLVERLRARVPEERILIVPLEAMKGNARTQYLRVLNFLGVPDDGRVEFPVANEARGHKSRLLQRLIKLGGKVRLALGLQRGFGLGRLNERPSAKEGLSREFTQKLELSFMEDKRLLKTLNEKQSEN